MNGLTPATSPEARGSWFGRASAASGDLLTMVAVICCIPFAILAFGLPIALLIRLLLWIGELF
jgi:hypothetical protein